MVELAQAGMTLDTDRPQFTVNLLDRTAQSIHMFLNLDAGIDPLTLINTSNQVIPFDRYTYQKTFDPSLNPGMNTVTVVAIEESGNARVLRETVTLATPCPADLTGDGQLNFFDVSAFLSAFSAGDPAADFTGDGQFNFFDVSDFLSQFSAGCP